MTVTNLGLLIRGGVWELGKGAGSSGVGVGNSQTECGIHSSLRQWLTAMRWKEHTYVINNYLQKSSCSPVVLQTLCCPTCSDSAIGSLCP